MNLTDYFPSIVSFEPNLTTESVSTLPIIKIRFNLELSLDQVSSDFNLNQLIILIEENSDSTTPVRFYDYQNRVLRIVPTVELNPGSMYQLTVLQDIVSDTGRTMGANKSFVFKVSPTDVPQVRLLIPANNTSVPTNSILVWNSVTTNVSGATGAVSYNIEIDNNITFNTVSQNGWSTSTTSTSALPGIALTQGQTYFWRVQASVTTIAGSTFVGQWSEPFCFYLGTFLQPSPSTRQTYPNVVSFKASQPDWINGESNLKDFPNLNITFSNPIDESTVTSDNVKLKKESVDGQPDSYKRDTLITFSVTGNVLYIQTAEAITPNTRYTLCLYNLADIYGNVLIEPFERYFTSNYTPLYLGANVIRANFGRFLIGYPDDLINFHIFRVSLDVNRNWILYYTPMWGGPTETQVRSMQFILTYPMERWTEHESALRILSMRYYELLEKVDQMKRLGDYTEQHGHNILRDLQDEIHRQKQLSMQWWAEFSRHRARSRSTRESERWPLYGKNTDTSFQNQRRDSI